MLSGGKYKLSEFFLSDGMVTSGLEELKNALKITIRGRRLLHDLYDLAIIGGGINGAGIAGDAAGRGLSVFLCEKDDLASHTSSASSKLIHGGLRYLEHKEFRLVREALAEREVLLKKAPHLVHPMRFIMPHQPHLRPAWLIRAGLFIYDYLGKREQLSGSEQVFFESPDSPLKANFSRGFEYSDCTVDDARLVVVNAMQAHGHGAKIMTRTICLSAQRMAGVWVLELEKDGQRLWIKSQGIGESCWPLGCSIYSAKSGAKTCLWYTVGTR